WAWRALHTPGRECFPELAAELLVAIVQQVTTAVQISCVLHRRVARHLLHPARVWMARDAAQRYPAAAHFHEEQYVVRHQPAPRQHLHSEEVGAGEHVDVRMDEFLPGRRATP